MNNNDTIYSPNFKKWFGDWETGENSSKVVDNTGKPLPVYHGTTANSDDGKPFKIFRTESVAGKGVMFANNPSVASFFSGGGNACFIDFSKKFKEWENKDTIEGLLSFLNNVIADGHYEVKKYQSWGNENEGNDVFYRLDCIAENGSDTSSYLGETKEEIYENLKDEVEKKISWINNVISKRKGGVYKVYLNIRKPYIFDAKGSQFDALRTEFYNGLITVFDLVSFVKQAGQYDGVIVKDVRETTHGQGYLTNDYIVFNANQIKHAIDNNGNFNFDSDDITENVLRRYIRKTILEAINEVRYIDTSVSRNNDKVYKNSYIDRYNQEPIKNDDKIRVYHGCSLETACKICIQGMSGKEFHPRQYSYENGMNPLGMFVTTDFETAKKFGTDNGGLAILEFTANASDLEAPVWNGQGSNPRPFNNAEERNAQKMKYRQDAQNIPDEMGWDRKKLQDIPISRAYIKNSDKPELARSIFDNNEHQALFMGDLNPNMIKRVWINPPTERGYANTMKSYQPVSVKDFLRMYRDKEWVVGNDSNYKPIYSKIRKEKLFNPNDNVETFDDLINAFAEHSSRKKSTERAKENLEFMGFFDNPPSNYAIDCMRRLLYPRQIIQLYGKDFFDKYFNRLGQ